MSNYASEHPEPTLTARATVAFKQRLLSFFARVIQLAAWPVLYPVFHLFFQLKFFGREHISSLTPPFIIVANHISFYDSFLFRLMFGVHGRHLPLRFMAVKKFDWPFLNFLKAIGIVDIVYACFGAFTITQGEGLQKGIETAKEIVLGGGNVVMYAEGGINKNGGVGEFKRGAAALAQVTGAPAIPVAFTLIKNGIRPTVCVRAGSPIYISPHDTYDDATAALRSAVHRLYDLNLKTVIRT